MLDVTVDTKPLGRLAERLGKLPHEICWARTSALKSTGYFVRRELAAFIRAGGRGAWPGLHPLTSLLRKKRGVAHDWVARRRSQSPLLWLARYARYQTDRQGQVVEIGFGKSRPGKPGAFDRHLVAVVRRVQQGERTAVTGPMRRLFGATRRRRPRDQVPGRTYFPLRKTTAWLQTPPRPIFDPVLERIGHRIPRHFEVKFLRALQRHSKGVVR